MRVLLDENFPLPLYYRLRADGCEVEHIIALGQRGIRDSEIRQRLVTEDLILLTNDTEFEDLPANYRGTVIISRVPQNLPVHQRVHLWSRALEEFLARRPTGKLFDLLETGEVVAWDIHEAD